MLKSAHWRVWDRCLGSIAVARNNLMDVNCDSVLRNRRKLESLEQWLVGTHLLVLSGKPLEIFISFSHSPLPPPPVVQATLNS